MCQIYLTPLWEKQQDGKNVNTVAREYLKNRILIGIKKYEIFRLSIKLVNVS